MPSDLIRVYKDGDFREVVVVIDDVSEVGHRFMPFVPGNAISGKGVINDVDCRLQTR